MKLAELIKDCGWTELWRIPLVWVPKVQSVSANLSGKRTKLKSIYITLYFVLTV